MTRTAGLNDIFTTAGSSRTRTAHDRSARSCHHCGAAMRSDDTDVRDLS
jgi:hypothetical protein